MADSHGRSITAGDSLVRRLQQLAWPPIDRALDDATGMRARMPHGRAETAVHGAVARMTKEGPEENTVRARPGGVANLASRRPHFVPGPSGPDCAARRDTVRAPKLASATKSMCTSILQHADEG